MKKEINLSLKRTMILWLFCIMAASLYSQAPMAIKYQAVARAANGSILLNQALQIRISILAGNPDGNSIYSETHSITTNAFGIVNLEIGNGTPLYGSFSGIQWNTGQYFIRLEADQTGSGSYEWLGTSQLLTVPYAFYANEADIRKMTDSQRDALLFPQEGLVIYNLSTGCINVRRSDNWFEICGSSCVPQPSIPDAGPDQTVWGNTAILAANTPEHGTGVWSVGNGQGGQFSDVSSPTSTFTGQLGSASILYWSVVNSCGAHSDSVTLRFCGPQAPVNAGSDQLDVVGNLVQLAAGNLASGETGYWSIIAGQGGNIGTIASPVSVFSGLSGHSYYLVWTVQSACQTNGSDTVLVSFADTLGIPCPGVPTLTYQGVVYHTVQIGTQCWMRENLNAGAMLGPNQNSADNGTIEKHCYDNNPINCLEYGGLYTWDEMMAYSILEGGQGICPSGWHIPAGDEFDWLAAYLGGNSVAGAKLKETGTWHWAAPNTGATNESGFRALAAGYRASNGGFGDLLDANYLNSSSVSNPSEVWGYGLSRNNGIFGKGSGSRTHSNSVRCIKNSCLPMGSVNAGPDQLNVTGTSTTLAALAPSPDETGTWTILSGNGGVVVNPASHNSTFSGIIGQSYELLWTLTDTCFQSGSDTMVVSFTAFMNIPCPGIPYLVYEGKTYNTVKIGPQCWIKENLNIGTMITGYTVSTNNGILEKYCLFDDTAICSVYGGLYQWGEMMQYSTMPGSQGICPSGWHIPTDEEWCSMLVLLDSTYDCGLFDWSTDLFVGGKLKETGYEHWSTTNTNATNETGFTALGGGERDYYGSTSYPKASGNFFTSTQTSATDAIWYALSYLTGAIKRDSISKNLGYSVRCLKNQ